MDGVDNLVPTNPDFGVFCRLFSAKGNIDLRTFLILTI